MVVGCLRLSEYIIDRFLCIQFLIDDGGIPFIGELELIFEIGETVIHRSRREHEDFRLHTILDNFFHQTGVAVFFLAFSVKLPAVSEVMRLVDNDEVIVPPFQSPKVDSIREASCPG